MQNFQALQRACQLSKSSAFHAQTLRAIGSSLPRKQLRFTTRIPQSTLLLPRSTLRHYSLFAGDSEPASQSQKALAKLESDANASPDDVEKQVKLFKELVVSGAERAVVSRWETAIQSVSCCYDEVADRR